MHIRSLSGACAAALMLGTACLGPRAQAGTPALHPAAQEEPVKERAALKPEVAALIKQATAVYAAMRSYRHISEYITKGQGQEGEVNRTNTFTLALERPNKFCYKSDAVGSNAAVSDGKTFLNYFGAKDEGERHTYYTKTTAAASYKGINIVSDVTFVFGSYLVALMLQGDVLADGEVHDALGRANARLGVEENGKKYDVLTTTFPAKPTLNMVLQGIPARDIIVQFYFDAATHLLRKSIETPLQSNSKATEIIENVLIDKPIPADTFQYSLPKNARLIVGSPGKSSRVTALAGRAMPPVLRVGNVFDHADDCSGPAF